MAGRSVFPELCVVRWGPVAGSDKLTVSRLMGPLFGLEHSIAEVGPSGALSFPAQALV